MDQAPGLLALQDRGPGFALLPGAARRSAPPLTKKKRDFIHLSLSDFFVVVDLLTVVRFLDERFYMFFLALQL